MDYLELGKYLIGSLPVLIPLVWRWYKDAKKETIKDYKDFLIELEEAYDKLIVAKREILTLTFDNKRLKEVNNVLTEKITSLEKQIGEIRAKIKL